MSIPCLRFAQRCVNNEKISEIAMQRQEASWKNQMTALLTFSSAAKIRSFLLGLAASAALIVPVQAQDFGERSHKPPQFPVENHPRVSEKDYKAALEKIPTPTEKYDPWGGAHTSEARKGTTDTAKSAKKSNTGNSN
jgi:hypothetical protein